MEQSLASITVTVYVPANNPDGFGELVPLLQTYKYGGVPPEIVV